MSSSSTSKGGSKKEAAVAMLKSAWRSGEALIRNKTKLELLTLTATNDEPWGPTGQQMHELAEASFDAEKFRQVWGVVLQRFEGEPAQWRRCYKALLLAEHLLKNSSQHVVQTILDAAGVIEGLKQFKYMDEKNKDHGINVSNRAKELCLLLVDPERIRAERQKAKALKDKFKGATREDMAAAVAPAGSQSGSWTSPGSSHGQPAPAAGSSSSARGYGQPSAGTQFGQMSLGGATCRSSGMGIVGEPRPAGHQALPGQDGGHLGESDEGEELAGGPRSSATSGNKPPAKGYTAVPGDAMAATAQRIDSLRQAGVIGSDPPSPAAQLGGATSSAAIMPTSKSYDNLSVARSGGSQSGKPSLQELMARKAGPKKLQEVHINPAIKAALGGIKLAPPQPASSSPSKPAKVLPPPPAPAGPSPVSPTASAPAVVAAPTPKPQGSVASSAVSAGSSACASPTSPAALVDLLSVPAPTQAHINSPASHSPVAHSPAGGSPWQGSSPMAAAPQQVPAAFDAFGDFHQGHGPSSPTAAANAAPGFTASFTKPGASPRPTINMTATASAGSPPALPAHMFAEPVLPAYGSAAGWGTHLAGGVPTKRSVGSPMAGGSPSSKGQVAIGADPFSEFDPFKAAH